MHDTHCNVKQMGVNSSTIYYDIDTIASYMQGQIQTYFIVKGHPTYCSSNNVKCELFIIANQTVQN